MKYQEVLHDEYRKGVSEGMAEGAAAQRKGILQQLLQSLPIEQVAKLLGTTVQEVQSSIAP